MKIDIISFTQKGAELSKRIKGSLPSSKYECRLFCASKNADMPEGITGVSESVYDFCTKRFASKTAVVFIGAMGIAVRAISPSVKNKLEDIPVLVIDENASYVIPVLSGHVGGANEMAKEIAEALNTQAVITTATDINDRFAIDLFAGKNNLFIENKDGIAKVSSKILSGKTITINMEYGHLEGHKIPMGVKVNESINSSDPDEETDVCISDDNEDRNALLTLRPKNYILGIGCKKGKTFEEIEEFVLHVLKESEIDLNRVEAVASIDVKKDEEGLKLFTGKYNIPFLTFTADELKKIEGDFEKSDFVLENVGVDNVCERAALAACEEGELVVSKKKGNGVTLAVCKKNWRVSFYE